MAAQTPAVWNKMAFTCPRCGRWFAEATIRIKHHEAEGWCCQSCYDGIRRSPGLVADISRCATCGGTLVHRTRTVNRDGLYVHNNGCPSKVTPKPKQRRKPRRQPRPDP